MFFVEETVAFPGQICYTNFITRERSRGYDCSCRESQRVKTGYRYTGRQRPGYHSRPFCDTILLWHTQKGVHFLCPKPGQARRCGKLSSNRVAADDNPMKLMSIAMRPVAQPPFPLEKLEEMTALMAGDGKLPD